jgi:transaldolase / glucose-6-phosphate isomerase
VTDAGDLVERIWDRDPTVWTGGDEAKWLGWLDEPLRMQEQLDSVLAFGNDVISAGAIDDYVVLGMGGSSLAPEVMRRAFGAEHFYVLDTTHPKAIRALEARIDPERTLFISASKSGTTLETRSHTAYFLAKGGQFTAVTDPESELESYARQNNFLRVFHGEPTIGGRYSALSPFGMVPAALVGIDVDALLQSAESMAERCRSDEGNPGYELGAAFGSGWSEGRDKICIAETDGGFGLWAEQLIAESTGKLGKGLVPAPGESPEGPDLQWATPDLDGAATLGGEFFRWEFAVAVAATWLEINPFDQPDVQAAKDKTNEVLAGGGNPDVEPRGSLDELFAQAQPGDYVAVQAFIDPTRDGELEPLIDRARTETGCVVTHNLGPRYLHSTGQLHKGGPNTGLFVQVVDDPGKEVSIPGRKFGFRRLIEAQAAADFASLEERGRRIVRIRLEDL